MSYPRPQAAEPDEFHGFDEARRLLWCHEARVRVRTRLEETDFLADPQILAVHVENTSRADRAHLTAFGSAGGQLSADTLYVDDPDQRLDVAAEFDHDFTHLTIAAGSELERLIAQETGWVIDMRALRAYDLRTDRRQTQRAVFLAHLGDMMAAGQIRGFLLGGEDSPAA